MTVGKDASKKARRMNSCDCLDIGRGGDQLIENDSLTRVTSRSLSLELSQHIRGALFRAEMVNMVGKHRHCQLTPKKHQDGKRKTPLRFGYLSSNVK